MAETGPRKGPPEAWQPHARRTGRSGRPPSGPKEHVRCDLAGSWGEGGDFAGTGRRAIRFRYSPGKAIPVSRWPGGAGWLSGPAMLATVLLAFVAGRAGPAVAKPEQWSVSCKSVKLETIDKQEVFGVGIHYVPEDFYYTEDTVIAKKTHKAGSPVDVISADFKTPTANYTLYLFDTSRDGEFTPQAPPFSGKGDGMVLAYPGLENWFVVPFRDRLVLGKAVQGPIGQEEDHPREGGV